MDNPRIIHAPMNGRRYGVTAPITQYDYGYLLLPEGTEMPTVYEIDFSNDEHKGTSLTVYGGAEGAEVPEELIRTGKDVFAFYYKVGDGYGKTDYTWRIPNHCRPSRDGETPTPSQQSSIDQLIVRSNEAVESAEQSASDADASAQSASQSAENAHDSAVDAQNYAESASGYASDAQGYANTASQKATAAGNSADQAAQIKTDIEGYVSTAQTAAQTATDKAAQASQSATNASTSATTATTKAGEASASATTASTKASEASGYASTASQKATEASQSASQALGYKTDAESAKTASQTAQGLAEDAQTAAETAQGLAEDAQEAAESAAASVSASAAQIATNTSDITDLKEEFNHIDGFFDESPNLVNPATITPNVVVGSNGVESSSTKTDTSDYIAVEPNEKYAWINLSYVCRYGADKSWKGRTSGTSQHQILLGPDVYYVRVCGATGTGENWRFNKGSTAIDKPYTDGAFLAESVKLSNQLDGVNANISDLQTNVNMLTPTYEVPYIPSMPYTYTGQSIVPYKTSGHLADIYALYDALVAQYPQYIQKQIIGTDASGQYEIRAYRIDNGTNYAYRLPRIVWLASIHGNEGNTTISTYYMVKELLDKFATDPTCYGILSAVRLYVIPAVNPWGIENYSRLNANNVNLNRNFPADWIYRDPTLPYGTSKYGIDSASNGSNAYYYYGGGTVEYDDTTQIATTTYVAEAETQAVMDFINGINTGSNLNGKIAFAVNKHDSGNMSEEGSTIYMKDNYSADRTFLTNLINWLKPLLMGTQNWLTQKSGLNLGLVTYSAHDDPASTGTMDKWYNAIGIHGGLVEIPKGAGSGFTDTEHFSDLCAINVEFGLNLLSNVIVNNAKLKDNTQTEQYIIVT